jgi:hypothetical protein
MGSYEPPVWTDSFDDESNVYIPSGGLAGVEIVSGKVRLQSGYNTGWVASAVITCPRGYRYDFILIEAITPGDSRVEVTVLNASAEASEPGFANETVPGYVKIDSEEVSVFDLGAKAYPRIRMQANLVASGSDRPCLLSWSLHFLRIGEWSDDFVTMGKMSDSNGINITQGVVELNLTQRAPSTRGFHYEPYPPIILTSYGSAGSGLSHVLNPKDDGTGYKDTIATMPTDGTYDFSFDDMDGDGDLDLVCANYRVNSQVVDSKIYWGTGSGSWGPTGAKALKVSYARGTATGDFNGDGELDIAFGCDHSGSTGDSVIFLNKGGGDFNYQPDIVLDDKEYPVVEAGDLNGDGYDDVVFARAFKVDCYFGGPDGPDKTVDISLTIGNIYSMVVTDIDSDGHLDIVPGSPVNMIVPIFLGGPDGPDTTADYNLNVASYTANSCTVGDVNGDGLIDLLFSTAASGSYKIHIFEGTSQGWSNAKHSTLSIPKYASAMHVLDLDKDGYEDLILGLADRLHIHNGDGAWPSTPDLIVNGLNYPRNIAIPASGGSGGTKHFRGSFTTEAIDLPTDRKWDLLLLEGTCPQNTSVEISILDANKGEVHAFTDLTDCNVDLSGLQGHQSIHVKVAIGSDLNDTTPLLERLTVKWMDEMAWREQFYGPAKIERVLGLETRDGILTRATSPLGEHQLITTSLMGDDGFKSSSHVFLGQGGSDYLSISPASLGTVGAEAVDAADINGDGLQDLILAVYMTSDNNFNGQSPLFLTTPVGWRPQPDHKFPTTGARDVLLEDLNGDGHVDVVFAQEQAVQGSTVNSTLFWGSDEGWSAAPDVEFATTFASGVAAADLDGDGDLDLAFACYKDASTSANSMVFLQGDEGFTGWTASTLLPTRGARAVSAADIDADGNYDLVFANSFSGGSAEIPSFIYWGKTGGGFAVAPAELPTVGAEDIEVADVDGDGDQDIVFANAIDNLGERGVHSYIYRNKGTRSFATTPDFRLPTVGASAVTVVDLDGEGWMDLVFACRYNGSSYDTPSVAYLGKASGWSGTPDWELPTEGASDVLAAPLLQHGSGAYLSRALGPSNPNSIGGFDTFGYTSTLGSSQSAIVKIVDSTTWELLAVTTMLSGTNDWDLEGAFAIRDHPSVRILVSFFGLEGDDEVGLDDLWLNWTPRARRAPRVLDLGVSTPSVHRTDTVSLWVNVTDEYDLTSELRVKVEYRLNGTEGWSTDMIGPLGFKDGSWRAMMMLKAHAGVGSYDFRASAVDSDAISSDKIEFPSLLEVLNNPPTAPEVRIEPGRPVTTSTLRAVIVRSADDREGEALNYMFRWYCDGELVDDVTGDTVPFDRTERGQNWTVDVNAFDGIDEGPRVTAWKSIQNAAPMPKDPLPDPLLEEDTTDEDWINLGSAFEDPDGDPVTWSLERMPEHIWVGIDESTGVVTLMPLKDWWGEEEVTFVASDGELKTSQTVTVTVSPVNDLPTFITVDDNPIEIEPVHYRLVQGELLVIKVGVLDIEGHELVFGTNTTLVDVNSSTGVLRFEPDNDAVGELRFRLTVHDVVSPTEKVSLDFVIEIVNENDPMDDPRITSPADGATFKVNQTFSLISLCGDPDIQYGQVLNYTWTSSMGGRLGHGSSIVVSLSEPGLHLIKVTVSDGEFQKSAIIEVEILEDGGVVPPPPPSPGDDPDGGGVTASQGGLPVAFLAVVLVILVATGTGIIAVTRRRRAETPEPEEEVKPNGKDMREALKQMAAVAKDAADQLEAERSSEVVTVDEDDGSSEVLAEIEIETVRTPSMTLSMETKTSETVSSEVESLWTDISNGDGVDPDTEQLRLDNLKRQYQNTIGRLPYGIPSPELQSWDWNELASALATGERRALPDGREITEIDGRWYHSDMEDASTFLKEHGAKPDPETRAVEKTATERLLVKLEERFILGEISEESYKELKAKYEQ